jgi:hypothetical protein
MWKNEKYHAILHFTGWCKRIFEQYILPGIKMLSAGYRKNGLENTHTHTRI